jgi:hypothetical protein
VLSIFLLITIVVCYVRCAEECQYPGVHKHYLALYYSVMPCQVFWCPSLMNKMFHTESGQVFEPFWMGWKKPLSRSSDLIFPRINNYINSKSCFLVNKIYLILETRGFFGGRLIKTRK